MTTNGIADTSKAVATREESGARALVTQYSGEFGDVLPSHVKPEQWLRLAKGALKKGKKVRGPNNKTITELELAAVNNPGVFLASLMDAARLGLEPGTEQYYLTPRKVKGQLEILGIVGYQGLIELMYRAGAISSVVAECVYTNDGFDYQPGRDERPLHRIDWDLDDRGALRLVYAYAVMQDRATSKVVVMNRQAIARIKAKSQGADSEYSPWKTNEPAMWLKSAVRQLAKWVPTSAEYRREQIRAARDVAAEGAQPSMTVPPFHDGPIIDLTGGTAVDDVLDGEIVEEDRSDEPADTGSEVVR